MLGAIIGDIVGSPYEFNNILTEDFPLFSRKSSFTDDTICTVAVADAILKHEDFGEALHRWCNQYPNPMGGYGGMFVRWVHSNHPKPYNSFGNGAAMRVSACGWAFDSEDETIRAAVASAAPTHNHAEGLKGASTVARAIFRLRQMKKPSFHAKEIKQLLAEAYGEDWQQHLPERGVFDGTCQGCVPLAFHICMQAGSFEDAIRKAVAYGGDSDTLAAIVGSFAEAVWNIPEDIKNTALNMLPAEMRVVVERFERRFDRMAKELMKYCLYYKGEADVPAEFHSKAEGELWVAERFVCEHMTHMIDFKNKKKSFATWVVVYVGKWDPFGWVEVTEPYWKKLGLGYEDFRKML